MTARPFDLAQTDKLLTTTRSVRKRLDLGAPVDLAEIQECIGNLKCIGLVLKLSHLLDMLYNANVGLH